jgi:hypothetical protein
LSAFIRRRDSFKTALSAGMNKKHQSKQRRLLKLLGQQGAVDFASPDREAAAPLIAEFLALEARGWKGRTGTALKSNPRHEAWFLEVVDAAFARNRCLLLALRLDGRMVAGRVCLLAGPGSFAIKIAYDETLGFYSPGQLLEVEAVRRLHEPADPLHRSEWWDSCALPGDGPMHLVWPDQLTVCQYRIASDRQAAGLIALGRVGRSVGALVHRTKRKAAAAFPALRRLKARGRRAAQERPDLKRD